MVQRARRPGQLRNHTTPPVGDAAEGTLAPALPHMRSEGSVRQLRVVRGEGPRGGWDATKPLGGVLVFDQCKCRPAANRLPADASSSSFSGVSRAKPRRMLVAQMRSAIAVKAGRS